MIVCIAEKPSVASDIADVLGAKTKKDGYIAVSYTHLDVYKRQDYDTPIEWMEVLAGERAFKETGSWLPDETMEAFKKYGVGIRCV